MAQRTIKQTIATTAVREGAGVMVRRTIGTPALRHLDPFLMLDHFSSDDPDDYIAGFPDHPHRGFNTFTYMLDGHMLHKDSMGNRGDLRSGAGQWMKAASGIIHSEMPQQSEGLMRGFQLWINLPAAEKMSTPAYQEFPPEAFPVVEGDGAHVKILIGRYANTAAPIQDAHTQVCYLDVNLAADARFRHALNPAMSAFLYIYEGGATLAGKTLHAHELAVLSEGDAVEIAAGSEGTRFIFVVGLPLGEPIVQYGPFVMNTRDEVEQAVADFRSGRLVKTKAGFAGR